MSAARKQRPKIDHPYVFSVSQVQNFLRCNHKWALEKIDGEVDPGSDSTELGGEVHDELEHYLSKGTPIGTGRAGKIAMSALPHLPPPRFPGMLVEEWFTVFIPDVEGKHGKGAYFQGLKDLEIPGGWRTHRPFVSDHKTTKNFMWAKTPEDLIEDLQAGLYSFDLMERTKAPEVDLQWTYMRTTSSPLAQPTCTVITRQQVDRIMKSLTETVQEMIRIRDEHPTAATVEKNPMGCDAFGGCYFKKKCNLEPKEKWRAIMNQEKKENSVLNRLKERKALKSNGAAQEPAAEKPSGEAKVSQLSRIKDRVANKESHLSVVESTAESVTSAVNPPEGANAPELPIEEKVSKVAKARAGKVVSSAKAGPAGTPGTESPGSLARALAAFWDVLADDLASRIAEKLQK